MNTLVNGNVASRIREEASWALLLLNTGGVYEVRPVPSRSYPEAVRHYDEKGQLVSGFDGIPNGSLTSAEAELSDLAKKLTVSKDNHSGVTKDFLRIALKYLSRRDPIVAA